MSRPTTLSKLTAKRLCAILSEGNTIETACAACGISGRSFHNWMERGGREKTGPYFQFFQSATRARARAKQRYTKLITRAATRDWKAAAWLLERMFPQEYGRSTREDKEGTKLNPITPPSIRITMLSDAESKKMLAEARSPHHRGPG